MLKLTQIKLALSKELLIAGVKTKKSRGSLFGRSILPTTRRQDQVRRSNQVSLQRRGMGRSSEKKVLKDPPTILEWAHSVNVQLEHQIKRALGKFTENNFMGKWAREQVGIGAVLSAGLLVHA